MFERWLAARDADAVRSAWIALAPRRVDVGRALTLRDAARLAELLLGTPFEWIANVYVRPPDSQSDRVVDACFLDDAWDVHDRVRETWQVHEQRDGARGVQVVFVGIGTIEGRPEGGSEVVVRIFDRDGAVSLRVGASHVSTIGGIAIDLGAWPGPAEQPRPRTIDKPLRVPELAPPSVDDDGEHRVWEWSVEGPFNPRMSVTASGDKLLYGREIQGPFCGYDGIGSQTWDELLTNGPLLDVPDAIATDIRAYVERRRKA